MPRVSTQTINAIARRLREIPRPSRTGDRQRRAARQLSGWFRPTAATQDGTNKRWVYTAKRLGAKSGAGYDGTWADSSVDTADYTLYSGAEKINGASGNYGNGLKQGDIDQANLAGGNYALAPLTLNMPVFAAAVFLDDGTMEWWIPNFPNGAPGNCGAA
jgi:hypothetical protein